MDMAEGNKILSPSLPRLVSLGSLCNGFLMFSLFTPGCRQWPGICQKNSFPAMFSTTTALNINRKPESKVRTPSKKALAAKARRRAALATKADARLLKLPLKEAIGVLRVSITDNLLFADLLTTSRPWRSLPQTHSMNLPSKLK